MGCRSFFELARWSSHLRRGAKMLNSTEDAHPRSMSTFEVDEIALDAHGKQTAYRLIEIGFAAQECDYPRHRSRPTCQGIGGVKGKLRFPGGTHSLATPSVRPQNLQTIGLV